MLNSAVKFVKSTPVGLLLPKLGFESLVIAGYADAGSTTNDDTSLQLGMIIFLRNKLENTAILHYSSWKCKSYKIGSRRRVVCLK